MVVTTPSVEPTTGLRGFWFNVPPGPVTAQVIGLDGGRRDLDASWVGPGAGAVRVIRGQTLTSSANLGSGPLWLDNCTFTGAPATGGISPLYMTGCTVKNGVRGVGPCPNVALVRNCKFYDLTDDGAQNALCIADVLVDGIKGSQAGQHADGAQNWGSQIDNRVIYRLVVKNADAQGIFHKTTSTAGMTGLAVIECNINLAATWGCGNGFEGVIRHGVFRGNVFTGYARGAGNGGDLYVGASWTADANNVRTYYRGWHDVIVEGNVFGSWSISATDRAAIPSGTFKSNKWGNAPESDGLP